MTLILIPFNELMTADPTEPVLPVVPKPVKEYLTGVQWKEIKKRLRADIGTPNEISNFAFIAVFAPCLFLCMPSYNTIVFQQKASKSCADLNTELFDGKDVMSVTVSGLFINPVHLHKISVATQPEGPQITVITPDKQPVAAAAITPTIEAVTPSSQEQVQNEEKQRSAEDGSRDIAVIPAVSQKLQEGTKVESSSPDSATITTSTTTTNTAEPKQPTETDTQIPIPVELPTSVLIASAPGTEVTPAIKTMSVEVPEGAVPGSTMTVMAPDDITQVVVAVPDDATPGQIIEVEY